MIALSNTKSVGSMTQIQSHKFPEMAAVTILTKKHENLTTQFAFWKIYF